MQKKKNCNMSNYLLLQNSSFGRDLKYYYVQLSDQFRANQMLKHY